EQRIGAKRHVAIALIEGEAGEAPRLALLKPAHGLIERHHVKAGFLHLVEHRIEKVRRHFEIAVRREGPQVREPYLVEREDHPGPLSVGCEQPASARVIKPGHGCAGHGSLYPGHANLRVNQRRSTFCSKESTGQPKAASSVKEWSAIMPSPGAARTAMTAR